jgi:Ferric reductase NAD binding domain
MASVGLSMFDGSVGSDIDDDRVAAEPGRFTRGQCSMQFHSGRPDMAAAFKEVAAAAAAAGSSSVAVLVCGNQGILDGCRKMCSSYNKGRGSVRFDCHFESFGFV